MMRARRAVLAVLTVGALLCSGCSLVGGGGSGQYTLVAYFPRAVSLYSQGQVRVLGLPAGHVDSVQVVGTQVKVVLKIDNSVPVPQDVKALLVPQSLIGERYIELSPAWRTGEPKATNNQEIHDTEVPVEPDEALAALKKFLDSLDPNGLGRLIDNASQDLQGQGPTLNDAISQISQLVSTFADKDDALVQIVDNFDQFTQVLSTRESQLGDIIQTFSEATQVLADERQGIENLVAGLASLSANGLELVSKHSQQLHTDLDTLARLAQSIDVNLNSLGQLLDSGPNLIRGLEGAYNPTLRALNLRTSFGPLCTVILNSLLSQLFQSLGLGSSPGSACPPVDTVPAQAASTPAVVSIPTATTPVDDLLALVGSPTVAPPPAPSTADRIADGGADVGSFLRGAAGALGGGS